MTQMNQLQQSGMDQLQNIVNQTAINTRSISQQLGIIASAVTDLKAHADQTDQKIEDMGNRMTGWEQRERVTPSEANRIKTAVKAKCYSLLGIEHEGGVISEEDIQIYKQYFGKFCSRCYTDARNKSRLGTPYYDTRKQDFEETMKYIENWEPEVSFGGFTGTVAYKMYLNSLQEL